MTIVIGYYYLLHVHMGGRMLDLYRRLHSPASHFFIPHDYEVRAPTKKSRRLLASFGYPELNHSHVHNHNLIAPTRPPTPARPTGVRCRPAVALHAREALAGFRRFAPESVCNGL